jgi:hypothetical protein
MSHFLTQLLPSQGLYCAAQVASKGFIHRFFDNIPALVAHIEQQDAAGHTMYVAQASYKTPENRKTDNAAYVRNFWFDIDAGTEKFAQTPDKAYPTQAEGCAAIKEFAKVMDLPLPTVVNSGNGLYAHFLINEDIPADKWKVLATVLKGVAQAAGFKQDPSRTSDTSSVLRPAGSTNRKNGNSKPVKILHLSEPISLAIFTAKLEAAAKKYKVQATSLQLPATFKGLNDEFTSGVEGPPSSLYQVAERCAQIRKIRDSQGNVDEPTWYNFLGMARYTAEGKEGKELLDGGLLHTWSQGHPDYSHQVTEAKIRQHELGGYGPTTCIKFATDNPAGCMACPHANSVKSPIVLGRPDPVSIATPEEEELAPSGYRRGDDGLFYDDGDKWLRFYPYDLYIESIAYDFTQGFETVTVKHRMPLREDYSQFSVRASLLHDPKQMLMVFADNHVQTTGGDSRKQMINYVDQSLAQMRAKRKLSNLRSQMGWHEDDGARTFVLGEHIYTRDAAPVQVGFAKNVPEAGKAFHSKGSLEAWKTTTKYLGMPGMEPFAFAFLAGAFGAPLIKFTGFAGAMVALIGDSGIGKTLLGEWIMSVYGDSQRLILLKDDTKNFLVQRLGLYGSLPLYVDEISNIEGQELSDLVYKITQGRDKGRLGRSGNERNNINAWNTIAIASSNHSLTDKLSALKTDASAEMNRIMEIDAYSNAKFGREESTAVYHTFRENFGLVGPLYINYITTQQDVNRDKIDLIVKSLDLATDAKPEERFWSAVTGCAIYGGLIASKLGLIDFPVAPILAWAKKHIRNARKSKCEQVTNYTDLLGQFLDNYSSGALVTSHNEKGGLVGIIREPRAPLVYRINEDTKRLYISRGVLKTYLEKNYGSYTKLRNELERVGALIDSNKRKVLGGGTYFGGAQQPVWEIDLDCMELGRRTLGLVKELKQVDGKAVGL